MKVLLTAFLSSLVLCNTVLADQESDCLNALQRCYDFNIFAIEEFIETAEMPKISDACMLYSNALKCMRSLPCKQTNEFKAKEKKLVTKLYKDVAGGCLRNGQIDPCLLKLVGCELAFQKADDDLNKHDAKAGCLEVAAFDKCLETAKKECPGVAVKDVMHDWEPLNKDAHREGCDVNCNDALAECAFDLTISDAKDKEDYCAALKQTQTCLKKTQDDVGCSGTSSQTYLDKVIKRKASKYTGSDCDGVPPSAQVSLLLFLVAITVSFLNKMSH